EQPIPGATAERTSWQILRRAYSQGMANLDDVANALAGPRGRAFYSTESFSTLRTLTARKLDPVDENFLKDHPEVAELMNRCRSIILDTELQRGETPTIVSEAANDIGTLEGVDTLVRLLSALGKVGFKKAQYYSRDVKSRAQSLTNLVSITNPRPDE